MKLRFVLLKPHTKMEQCVPKRRYLKFKRRGITQRKNTAGFFTLPFRPPTSINYQWTGSYKILK